MTDDIRRLSEEWAREPASPVYLELGEALRRAGQRETALKVAARGVEQHPLDADAHDLLARVRVDRGELDAALAEWQAALALHPDHAGAHRGMGYAMFKQGRLEEAERHLAEASRGDGDAAGTALHMVRRMRRYADAPAARGQSAVARAAIAQRRLEEESRRLFADILGDGEQTALLLDGGGLVTAGAYVTADGRDVAQEVGTALAAARDDAARVVRHVALGEWQLLLAETGVATIAIAPVGEESLVIAAAATTVPVGLVRRVLERCVVRARQWLAEGA